ncbi:MAG: hypothetical protein J0I77_22470 [Rudaea sp.]|uniref:hypothetical protein n=1 Tax=unclassified Rudaea TaxID=2627037 RepID=UPI0010F6A9C0|nr:MULTISPECIES: hypothetical protein [unclassified Rudaea]MBN8888495.1 hypothetical protein [Rudaea sp.]
MKPAFWARRAHKWIGLIIGVQALLWMVSGVYMTSVSLDVIHGDHLADIDVEPLQSPSRWLDSAALAARYPDLMAYKIKQFMGKDAFEIHHGGKVLLIDAVSGAQITPLDESRVRALAASMYQGDAAVRAVEWITQAPSEVATRPVPMWAVSFADRGDTTLYFSPDTGELLARRHDLWRWFDFLWMFHIMDYESRTDVNNNLLRTAAASGFAFAASGLWLLFYSFRRRAAA